MMVSLTAQFHKNLSNELFPICLDVYYSYYKLVTVGVNPRTGVIFVIYEKGDKKGILKDRLISLLNLDCKIYTPILKKCKKP